MASTLPDAPAPAKGNVLLVANWDSGVGYAWWLMENFWAAIARRYEERATSILAYPSISTVPTAIAEAPIELEDFPFGLGKHGTLATLRWVRAHRIRNIYLTDRPFVDPLYLWLRLAGVRRIVVHDHTPGDRPPTTGVRRLVKRALHSIPWIRADYFVGVTEFIERRLVENANLPASRCGHARNGIIPVEESERGPDVREVFGLPKDAVVVISTGRANRYKGIDFILDVARELVIARGQENVRFVHCGDGPDLERFQARAIELDLGDRFLFAGRRSDVRALLGSCDIGIQAAEGEVGYSLSILEYMSAGLATLVPDRPSTALATEHGRTGLVFPPGDVDTTANELEGLLSDPARRQALGAAARDEVLERYRLGETNRQLLELLDRWFV